MRAGSKSVRNGDLHLGTTVRAWVRQRKKLKYGMVVTKTSADPVECSGLRITFQSCHKFQQVGLLYMPV